jgi:hypothetical protein
MRGQPRPKGVRVAVLSSLQQRQIAILDASVAQAGSVGDPSCDRPNRNAALIPGCGMICACQLRG